MDAASFPYTYSHAAYQIPEVTDWFTSNMSPGTTECGTVLSKTAYEELPDQYQQLLEDVKDEAYEVQVQAYQDIDKVNLPKFREQLTEVTYSDEVLQEFRAKAGQAVWEEWIEANKDLFDSQQLFDDLVAEIEKAGATVQ